MKLVETGRQSWRYCAPSWSWASWDSIPQLNETTSCLLQDGIAMDTMPTWFNNCCSVMKMASLDYIWVDSLCINQTDLAERSRETLRMPEIYRSAEMTIVPRIPIEGRRYHKRQLDWGKLRLHCRDDTYQTLSRAKEIMTEHVWESGFNMTPLQIAVMRGHTEVVKLLLEKGAKVETLLVKDVLGQFLETLLDSSDTTESPQIAARSTDLVLRDVESTRTFQDVNNVESAFDNTDSAAESDSQDSAHSTGNADIRNNADIKDSANVANNASILTNADLTMDHAQTSADACSPQIAISDFDDRSQTNTTEKLCQSGGDDDDQEREVATNEQYAETISAATRAIRAGQDSLQEGNTIKAIGNFQYARDLATSLTPEHSNLTRLHLITSSYLALIYLKGNMAQFALNTITASETLMANWTAVNDADTLA